VLGFAAFVAVLPAPAAAAGGLALARSRSTSLERVRTALEQVLDRLEHGEIRMKSADENPLARIAKEIRRQLGP
jgi:hypothetical protein